MLVAWASRQGTAGTGARSLSNICLRKYLNSSTDSSAGMLINQSAYSWPGQPCSHRGGDDRAPSEEPPLKGHTGAVSLLIALSLFRSGFVPAFCQCLAPRLALCNLDCQRGPMHDAG